MTGYGFTGGRGPGGTGGGPGGPGGPGRPGGDGPDDEDGPADPFAGLSSMLGGMFGGGAGGAAGASGAPFFAELQKLMSSQGGPVNWELARQTAVHAASDGDVEPTPSQRQAVAGALRLADLWLDPVTTLPAAGGAGEAWTRARWVEQTLPVWRTLCDPVAESVVAATSGAVGGLGGVPEELRSAMGPLMGVFQQVGGMVFGLQLGQALGALAKEVVGSSDVGVPLVGVGRAALLPAGVQALAAGLDVDEDQVRLYLALREAAHARLFTHVPWLRDHVLAAVTDYARGLEIDTSGVDRLMQNLDPSRLDPQALQEAMGEGLFQPRTTPTQQAALTRLETLLALVEGWVDEVVDTAAREHLPASEALRETLRRRRAGGGPAEQTFATLVGLELRPRRLREAAALWRVVLDDRGIDGRDAVWASADDLPGALDLDDPQRFTRREDDVATAVSSLDDELRRLTEPPAAGATDPTATDEPGPDDPTPGARASDDEPDDPTGGPART